jgi:hypothetical protein
MTLSDLMNKTPEEQKEVLERNATSKKTYLGKDKKTHIVYQFDSEPSDTNGFQLTNLDWTDD